MQQAELTRTAAVVKAPQLSAEAAVLTSEDTFEAMRQAAVTLFKQRTKDLTKLSELQEHHQALALRLAEAQTVTDDLQAYQARVEAAFEREEQRAKERGAQLQQLHSAMTQLREEQNLLNNMSLGTERVAALARKFLAPADASEARVGGDDDNTVARLARLLEAAQTATAGTSAGDYRSVASDLRRREAAVDGFVSDAKQTCAVPPALRQSVEEWVCGSWHQQRELTGVLAEASALVSALNEPQEEPSAADGAASASAPAVGVERLLPSVEDYESSPESMRCVVSAATARAADAVKTLQSELTGFCDRAAAAATQCANADVCCALTEKDDAQSLHCAWDECLATLQAAAELSCVCAAEGQALRAQKAVLQTLHGELAAQEQRKAAYASELVEVTERHQRLEEQVANYAAAWEKACHLTDAQSQALQQATTDTQNVHAQIACATEENAAKEATLEEETAAADLAVAKATDAASAAEDDAAKATVALAAAVDRQQQCATLLERLQACADELDNELGSAAPSAMSEEALAALMAKAAALDSARALVAHPACAAEEEGEAAADAENGETLCWPAFEQCTGAVAPEVCDTLCRVMLAWDGDDASALTAALKADAATTPFVASLESPAALSAVRALRTALCEQEASSLAHEKQLTEIARETALLEKELQD